MWRSLGWRSHQRSIMQPRGTGQFALRFMDKGDVQKMGGDKVKVVIKG